MFSGSVAWSRKAGARSDAISNQVVSVAVVSYRLIAEIELTTVSNVTQCAHGRRHNGLNGQIWYVNLWHIYPHMECVQQKKGNVLAHTVTMCELGTDSAKRTLESMPWIRDDTICFAYFEMRPFIFIWSQSSTHTHTPILVVSKMFKIVFYRKEFSSRVVWGFHPFWWKCCCCGPGFCWII